ncbi:hypothetical protein ACFQ1I_14055 [Kitasatospora arboriphila]
MTTRARLTISAATATALTALCLLPLITTHGWFVQAVLLVLVAAGAAPGCAASPSPAGRSPRCSC